tara:strand:- start:147 stop:392 length:246 start_codon:yes stop_codon:yes gene_type:complete
MARPIIYTNQTKCATCEIEMPPSKFKKPYSKNCPACKLKEQKAKAEMKQLYKDLKARNARKSNKELEISSDSFSNSKGGKL